MNFLGSPNPSKSKILHFYEKKMIKNLLMNVKFYVSLQQNLKKSINK